MYLTKNNNNNYLTCRHYFSLNACCVNYLLQNKVHNVSVVIRCHKLWISYTALKTIFVRVCSLTLLVFRTGWRSSSRLLNEFVLDKVVTEMLPSCVSRPTDETATVAVCHSKTCSAPIFYNIISLSVIVYHLFCVVISKVLMLTFLKLCVSIVGVEHGTSFRWPVSVRNITYDAPFSIYHM